MSLNMHAFITCHYIQNPPADFGLSPHNPVSTCNLHVATLSTLLSYSSDRGRIAQYQWLLKRCEAPPPAQLGHEALSEEHESKYRATKICKSFPITVIAKMPSGTTDSTEDEVTSYSIVVVMQQAPSIDDG